MPRARVKATLASMATLLLVASLPLTGQGAFYAIPEIYADIANLNGQSVSVFGEYVSDEDSKLVTAYGLYQADRLMPPSSILFLDGTLPESAYWYGGTMIVTGILSIATNPYPVYPQDTLYITITASSYEYLDEGFGVPPALLKSDEPGGDEGSLGPDADCDPCKFAILVSGGGDAAQNKPSYWENIEALYKHKTEDSDSGGGGYCPENVKVIYFDGNSGDAAAIPDSMVDSATQANVQKAHDDLAKKIADCNRQGKDATVQKMFTNHGSNDAGVLLLGDEYLSPEELKNMQQKLIDSCCSIIYDEFLECYGGDMLNGLKGIDDKGKTEIHGNSVAGESTPGWSNSTGTHEYLKKKIARLQAGDSYETAVDSAKAAYKGWLVGWIDKWQKKVDSLTAIHDTIAEGATKTAIGGQITKYEDLVEEAGESRDEASPSWVRFQFKEYCEWKKVVCPPGGQFHFKFKGTGVCGNVSVYKIMPDGSRQRVKVFNWNVPGTSMYEEGQEDRYISVDSTGGTYWVHNDNGAFTVTIDSWVKQDSTESESNIAMYAGGSCGGSDMSWNEFFWYGGGDPHTSINTFGEGFNLQMVPAWLCPFAGCGVYTAQFDIPVDNEWWGDMEVWMNVYDCLTPGLLIVGCDLAEFSPVQVYIEGPGIYYAHLGAVQSRGATGELTFDAATNGITLAWDSWGLRSLVEVVVDADDDFGDRDIVPSEFSLKQNFPNPFNSSTIIGYSLERPAEVQLNIYNILGQTVRQFAIGKKPAGPHQVTWDGLDSDGDQVPSGVYFYRLDAGDYTDSKKMLLLK